VAVKLVFESDPGKEGDAECEVEEAFVGDCEDDEDGRKRQEDYKQAVEVVIIRFEAVDEWDGKGSNYYHP